jgi:hypothetical protein
MVVLGGVTGYAVATVARATKLRSVDRRMVEWMGLERRIFDVDRVGFYTQYLTQKTPSPERLVALSFYYHLLLVLLAHP